MGNQRMLLLLEQAVCSHQTLKQLFLGGPMPYSQNIQIGPQRPPTLCQPGKHAKGYSPLLQFLEYQQNVSSFP